MNSDKVYIAIDLKSFYASVESIERKLDPMTTNLVVADKGRTEKTIGLAVSPSLKSFGIPGRPRLFEVVQKVKEVNNERRRRSGKLVGESYNINELKADPSLAVSYIVAPPRMAHYMEYSTRIYQVYLKHVAPEDIHVYSIDEVFIDATGYLKSRGMTGHEFARMLIRDVLATTGITATVGIGTNLYLAKVAMDIMAKKMPADEDGVRIAELDEITYRKELWDHRPLTDFWRVGKGYERTLEANGMFTMGDVARCSIGGMFERRNEALLYKLFGVNAELLIDHAWGYEPCTIEAIKSYKPETKSLTSGQVLHCPYEFEKAKLVIREMADLLSLDLVEKGLVTNQIVLTVGYDIENLTDPTISKLYKGEVTTDHYGRKVPKHSLGTANFKYTSSTKRIVQEVSDLFDRIVNPDLLIRRMNISVNRLILEGDVKDTSTGSEQLSMFVDYEEEERKRAEEDATMKREKQMQTAIIDIKKRYGKNAILKGMNLEEGATAKDRNSQIGGHKA